MESSGPIAVLSLAFVTGLGWRRSDNKVRNIRQSFLLFCVHMSFKRGKEKKRRERETEGEFNTRMRNTNMSSLAYLHHEGKERGWNRGQREAKVNNTKQS